MLPPLSFSDLSLKPSLLKAISRLGYENPTNIQEKAIPLLLQTEGDFVAQAATGTGKTAAFVLPLLQRLKGGKSTHPQALVLTPTRELANQIQGEIEKLAKNEEINSVVIYGGTSYERQFRDIKSKKPQIIVGTPGRVIDLINRKKLSFKGAEYLVLDEADEMLNMGFIDDVQEILNVFPAERKTWMFSATMSKSVLKLIQKNFHQPEFIEAEKTASQKKNIEQIYYMVKSRQRIEGLCRILDQEGDPYGIIFCQTRQETQDLSEKLNARGFRADVLNGDLGQAQRERAMKRFRERKTRLMVCTDVASRGIDIDNLTHVFNFSLPRDIESYIHRIGRTGRAGMTGIAISLVTPDDFSKIRQIEKVMDTQMTRKSFPSPDQLKTALVQKEVTQLQALMEVAHERGGIKKQNSAFKIYFDALQSFDKEDLIKLFFSRELVKPLNKLDQSPQLEEIEPPKVRYSDHRVRQSKKRSQRGGGHRSGGAGSGSRRFKKPGSRSGSAKKKSYGKSAQR